MDRLKTIADFIQIGSHASPGACYSAAHFLIGNALHNCYFEDDLGSVYTNLSFIFVAPSSTDKTPLKRILAEVYRKELKDQGMHFKSKFTTEGLMNFLNGYKKRYDDKGEECPRFNVMVLRDEASNLAKESKSGRSANIWEFLSECYDGEIDPYDTVRGRDQTYPEIWMSLWFTSTPTLYQHLNDDFWEQGFGFRSLFIKPEKKPYEPLRDGSVREAAIQGIIAEMIPLFNIEGALATEEWWRRYNEYVKPIRERGNDEIDKLEMAENTEMAEKAEKKYPEIVIKLSMIHCASRDGWKEKDGVKYLWMELQDLENAIRDLETYKENFIHAYNSYLFKKRDKAKIEKIPDEDRKKIIRLIKEAPPDQRMDYRQEYGDDKKLHLVGIS